MRELLTIFNCLSFPYRKTILSKSQICEPSAEVPGPLAGSEGTSGNFNIIITKDKARKTGQRVQINYRLELRTSYPKAVNPLIGKASYEDMMQSLGGQKGFLSYRNFSKEKFRQNYLVLICIKENVSY